MSVLVNLIRKLLREQRWTLSSCIALLALLFTLATYLYKTFGDTNLESMTRVSPQLLSALFGGLFGGIDPLEAWLMTLYLHPLVLTLLSVVVVAVSSHSLAGEVDRGTIDILLAYPVARWKLVAACSIVIIGSTTAMIVALWWSMRLGLQLAGETPPGSLREFRWITVNLLALFLAAGAVSTLFSASTSDQGRAMGRSIGFLVGSFFINLIAGLWQKVAWLDVVSIFHYYRPQPTLSGAASLWSDLAVLLGVALLGFASATLVFTRRDIATV